MLKWSKRKYLVITLMILGLMGWFGDSLANLGDFKNSEFPLGHLKGIAVDDEGRIFCGSQYYSRVQVYDRNGKFLTGWFVDSSGGAFKLKLDKEGKLHIATVRNGFHYVYNSDGKLLKKLANEKEYYEKISTEEQQYKFQDNKGDVYKISEASWLYPQIAKTNSHGENETIIRTPFLKWLVMAPFPSFLFGFAGIVTLLLTSKKITLNFKRKS